MRLWTEIVRSETWIGRQYDEDCRQAFLDAHLFKPSNAASVGGTLSYQALPTRSAVGPQAKKLGTLA
jgi:hypothetical protein